MANKLTLASGFLDDGRTWQAPFSAPTTIAITDTLQVGSGLTNFIQTAISAAAVSLLSTTSNLQLMPGGSLTLLPTASAASPFTIGYGGDGLLVSTTQGSATSNGTTPGAIGASENLNTGTGTSPATFVQVSR